MTIIKTLGFTLCITAMFSFIIAAGLFQVAAWQTLTVFAVLGLFFYYLFGPEDNLQSLSLVFITSAVFLVITGFLSNAAVEIFAQMIGKLTKTGATASLFGKQNVLLSLTLLFVGLFAPALALLQFKEKQSLDYKLLLRCAVSAGLVYLLVWFVYTWAISRVIGTAAVVAG